MNLPILFPHKNCSGGMFRRIPRLPLLDRTHQRIDSPLDIEDLSSRMQANLQEGPRLGRDTAQCQLIEGFSVSSVKNLNAGMLKPGKINQKRHLNAWRAMSCSELRQIMRQMTARVK